MNSWTPPTDFVAGHEYVSFLRQQLEYLAEQQMVKLEGGDGLLFAARLRHRWRNSVSTVTNALIDLSGFLLGETHTNCNGGTQSKKTKVPARIW